MSAGNTSYPSRSIGEASTEVVVHAFDLLEAEAANLPDLLQKSLNSPDVTKAIDTTLKAFLNKQMNLEAGKHKLTPAEANALAMGVIGAAGDKMGDAAMQQVRSSQEYRALEQSVHDFEQASRSMTTSVWVDKAAKKVYVSGTVLKIAGVAFLYIAKVNGKVTNEVIKHLVLGKSNVIPVGSLKLQGELLSLDPATHSFAGNVSNVGTIEAMKVTTTLGVAVAHEAVQSINGKAVVKVGDFTVNASASDPLQGKSKKASLAVSVGRSAGKFDVNFGISSDKGQLSGTVTGSYGNVDLTGKASGKEQSVMVTVKLLSF